jgi:hypothetical protein
LKGTGTSGDVLHLYDNFHQKCSKLGIVTTKARIIDVNEKKIFGLFRVPQNIRFWELSKVTQP